MCNYNFDLPVDPLELMEIVLRMIEENGGAVTGELPNVSVSISTNMGRVVGRCKLVKGSLINLQITKKPDLMTCTLIRDQLVFFLTEAVKSHAMQTAAAK